MKLGVFAVLAVLLVSGCSDDGDTGAGGLRGSGKVDSSAIELPDELAGLRDRSDVVADKSGDDRGTTDRDNFNKSVDLTKAWYDRAYDGAGFGMRAYADDDLKFLPTVIAVRAPSPGLTGGPIADPEVLGVEAGPSVPAYIESDGVECIQYSVTTVPAGKTVDPDDIVTGLCLISDDAHTVFVFGINSGQDNQAKGIELAKAAFDATD